MSFGSPTGVSEDEVAGLAAVNRAALFRTGTRADGVQPPVNGSYIFTTGDDQVSGVGVEPTSNGNYRVREGTWLCQAVIRSGNYSAPAGLAVWQWRNRTTQEFIGGQAIHYANSSTTAYTHQPVMSAFVVVPAGSDQIITPMLVGITNGLTFVVSEQRSSLSIVRVA